METPAASREDCSVTAKRIVLTDLTKTLVVSNFFLLIRQTLLQNLKYSIELERIFQIRTGFRTVTNELPEMPITWPKKHLNAMSQHTLNEWGEYFLQIILKIL